MTTMARIEKMSLLQQVDLFAHLDADETLRMAAIAEERRVGVGETIFQRDDDALEMFCVVDGEVRLTGGAGEDLRIGARGRFGVLDILAGRHRSATAVAERETRLLVIEADDFFDLLASDVGIVRALFAQLVELGPPSAG